MSLFSPPAQPPHPNDQRKRQYGPPWNQTWSNNAPLSIVGQESYWTFSSQSQEESPLGQITLLAITPQQHLM